MQSCAATTGRTNFATTKRGNATTSGVWLKSPLAGSVETWLETKAQYDGCGNVRYAWDALGRQSEMEYSATYQAAYPTTSRTSAPDTNGTYGSNVPFETTTTYDFTTGRVLSVRDADNRTTTTQYYGAAQLNRVHRVTGPDAGGGLGQPVTEYEYSDTPNDLWVKTQTKLDNNGPGGAVRWLESYQYADGLGRSVRGYTANDTTTQTDANCAWSASETQYDTMGRVLRTSQPFCAVSVGGGTPGTAWTTPTYDDLGRVTQVTTPDNAAVTTSYDLLTSGNLLGSTVTVTDQAGKQRRSVTDALGRLARVDEPTAAGLGAATAPNQPTHYTYDLQGNLRRVDQGGQLRHFQYDSLNRLLRVKNPEQGENSALGTGDAVTGYTGGWSLGYAYDAAGNLVTRMEARGVVTSYAYDNLNRNTTTTYSNEPTGQPATPQVKRYYDGFRDGAFQGGAYVKGVLWQTETVNTAQVTLSNFDNLSRPRTLTQAFYANGGFHAYRYEVKREYDLTGAVTQQIYPSGHEVKYNFDAVKRLGDVPDANPQQPDLTRRAFNGNLGDGVRRSYADTPRYDERGLMTSERYGTLTPLYQHLNYNVRGQMTDLQLGTSATPNVADAFNRGRLQNYYASTTTAGVTTPLASGPNNNGNLLAQDNSLPAYPNGPSATTFRQTYGYDELNRLTGVREYANGGTQAQWQQQYDYDPWGNRTINQNAAQTFGSGIPKPNFAVDTATNRLQPGAGLTGAMSYDDAGNLTNDTATGAGARHYDAENRMLAAQSNQSNVVSWQRYRYDGDGRRIMRFAPDAFGPEGAPDNSVWQIYGFGGELLAEYAATAVSVLPQKEYGYQGGKLLITASNGDDKRLRRFVENLYYRTWGYLPEGKGTQNVINNLVTALGNGGQSSVAAMLAVAQTQAATLFTSSQYLARVPNQPQYNGQYVADLYLAYLQRVPDTGGFDYWKMVLDNGWATRAAVRDAFAGVGVPATGSEFGAIVISTLRHGEQGDYERLDKFLDYVYQTATGALPSTAQRAAQHTDFDAAGAQGLAQVKEAGKTLGRQVLGAGADNYRQSLSSAAYVGLLYQTFLRRAPDAGASYWEGQANSNRSAVLEAFLAMSAYNEQCGALYREIFWLISDHLGTPRFIAERTGSLAGIKRNDYLPFGESANALGGRANPQGYVAESVRQGFTQYERDDETGLDYAQARYFASVQGRFISVDPLLASGRVGNPKSWNRYAYALNNPLRYTDGTGLLAEDSKKVIKGGATKEEMMAQERQRQRLRELGYYVPEPGANYREAPAPQEQSANAGMTLSQQGIGLLKDYEGKVSTGGEARLDYYDNDGNNNCTVGWGHLVNRGSCSKAIKGKAITREEAETLLANDIATHVKSVQKWITVKLTQTQFDALVMLDFTYGLSRQPSLRTAINAGDFASPNISKEWRTVTGAKGLPLRRNDELELFYTGDYKRDFSADPYFLRAPH